MPTQKKTSAQPTKKKSHAPKRSASDRERPLDDEVEAVLASLKRLGNKRTRDEMGPRYGIHTDKAFGVGMAAMQKVAKEFRVNARGDRGAMRRNHELALALWETGWYEARTVAAFVDEPECVTPAQMDRWCRDFDNWGICDTVCFKLFDRSPHAFGRIPKWAKSREEFVKRGAFALLACLALHDKPLKALTPREEALTPTLSHGERGKRLRPNLSYGALTPTLSEETLTPTLSHGERERAFAECLPLIERAASDERNFVKKGVSWALRAIGERNLALHQAALVVAKRLTVSPSPAARWVGKDAVRALTSSAVTRRLASRHRAKSERESKVPTGS